MTSKEIDTAVDSTMKAWALHARGCGWVAIEAQEKLRRLRDMSLDQRRNAYRSAIAEGLTLVRPA